MRRGEDPGGLEELGRIDLAAARPCAVHIGGNQQGILKQCFDVELLLLDERSRDAGQDEIVLSLAQARKFGAGRCHFIEMQHHARVLAAEALDGERENGGHDRRRTPDPQLARRRIGQERDVPYSLPQLVECGPPALEQGAPIDRRLDAAWIAVEQPCGKHLLEAGHDVRNGRLGQSELDGRLGHTAGLRHRKKHLQVPEPQAASDLLFPNDLWHR